MSLKQTTAKLAKLQNRGPQLFTNIQYRWPCKCRAVIGYNCEETEECKYESQNSCDMSISQ